MARLGEFMNPQQAAQAQQAALISKAVLFNCPKCGGIFFEQRMVLGRVSPLEPLANGKESFIAHVLQVCAKPECDQILGEIPFRTGPETPPKPKILEK